jgi:hypothetical protein
MNEASKIATPRPWNCIMYVNKKKKAGGNKEDINK